MIRRASSTDPLASYNLLPAAFPIRRRGRRACYLWFCVTAALAATLAGVRTTDCYHRQSFRRSEIHVQAVALPIASMRDNAITLKEENRRLRQWCELVETARPDDSLLQTLASVAAAVSSERESVEVTTITVVLPDEHASSATDESDGREPAARSPLISITGRVRSAETAKRIAAELESSPRIESVAIADTSRPGEAAEQETTSATKDALRMSMRIDGTPVVARVLP